MTGKMIIGIVWLMLAFALGKFDASNEIEQTGSFYFAGKTFQCEVQK